MKQKNDAHQSGYNVDLISNVDLIRRDDRYAEYVVKAGCEYRQPHQRANERRKQSAALLHEFDDLADGNGAQRAKNVDRSHERSWTLPSRYLTVRSQPNSEACGRSSELLHLIQVNQVK